MKKINCFHGYFLFDDYAFSRFVKKNYKYRFNGYIKPNDLFARRLHLKSVKNLELMRLDFIFNNKSKIASCKKFLYQLKNIKNISIHHIIYEDDDIKQIYLLLKRCKYLKSLDINTISKSEFLTDVGIFWFNKLLKLLNKSYTIGFRGFRDPMTSKSITKSIKTLSQMKFLKSTTLELSVSKSMLCLFEDAAKVFEKNFNEIQTHMFVKYYDTIDDHSFKTIFHSLSSIKKLKELSVYLGLFNYDIRDPIIAITHLARLFKSCQELEIFSLDMRLEQEIPIHYALYHGQNLKELNLILKESKSINDVNMISLSDSISTCINLRKLLVNFSRCYSISDFAVAVFCDKIKALKILNTIQIILGDRINDINYISGHSLISLSKLMQNIPSIESMYLSLSGVKFDKEHLHNLLHGIGRATGLKEIRLEFAKTALDSEIFDIWSEWLINLENLVTFELDLSYCKKINNEFLDLIDRGMKELMLHLISFKTFSLNLVETGVKSNHISRVLMGIRDSFPKSFISIYSR